MIRQEKINSIAAEPISEAGRNADRKQHGDRRPDRVLRTGVSMPKHRHRMAYAALAAVAALAAGLHSAVSTGEASSIARACPTGTCFPGGSNSFTLETQVLMADRTYRSIGEVRAGDEVIGTDPQTGVASRQPVLGIVTGNGIKEIVRVGTDTGYVTATAHHQFWVADRGGWSAAAELRVGYRLLGESGEIVTVTSLQRQSRHAAVGNIQVAGPHTYRVHVGSSDLLVRS
ncbi:polymorphic toxin-type HINT domain-containing protein [Micromonospora sp. NPDC000089]|uniref:polymorphic toxin-type HINT domain-containing protein n=1 Tax=unclassified Micromonospora TaxID=2617518 RepID=UPI0036A76870